MPSQTPFSPAFVLYKHDCKMPSDIHKSPDDSISSAGRYQSLDTRSLCIFTKPESATVTISSFRYTGRRSRKCLMSHVMNLESSLGRTLSALVQLTRLASFARYPAILFSLGRQRGDSGKRAASLDDAELWRTRLVLVVLLAEPALLSAARALP